MEPDFSGWATKAGLKCSDGRTIMKDAFAHQDKVQVPLVWSHGHADPENVLGHAILEARNGDIYTHGYFNSTPKGQAAKEIVQHGDVDSLSIFANQLVEKSKQVFHGIIREVSLVLAGANPGAKIEFVGIQHSDGEVTESEDEAVITTGLSLEHTAMTEEVPNTETSSPEEVAHAGTTDKPAADVTVQDVYDSMNDQQKEVVNLMIGAALEAAGAVQHSDSEDAPSEEQPSDDSTSADETPTNDEESEDAASDDDKSDNNEEILEHQEGNSDMTRNVFEDNDGGTLQTKTRPTLTHDQLKTIVEDGPKYGSLKQSFLEHAAEYGIENIDILFPDAKSVNTQPDVIGRRQEWVADVLGGSKHSPFSRIKSTAVDLTADEARAKGYVKGNLKKDEIIRLLKRVTTPTTIYKKQKLDRDDVVDITDLDVIAWLKAEMRLMLDEELARAVLLGDGRESDDEDKVDEEHIRPIAYDVDMYAHSLVVASELSPDATVEAIVRARTYYKGTGTPTLYTTDAVLIDLLLIKDKVGRRVYETEGALAAALRVAKVVTVEVMNDYPDIVGIMVNMADYTIGADAGGNVAMFDDFDIDYNQYKYLIETRVSGCLTKPKSALVVKRTLGTVVTPTSPSYNGTTHELTIPAIAGVVYEDGQGHSLSGTVTIDETTDVEARPASGYSFPSNTVRDWTYVYTP